MPKPNTISLSVEDRGQLKAEATNGRAYADRISVVLAYRLLGELGDSIDKYSILDEIDYLDGVRSFSKTKDAAQFRNKPLYPLWHKHFCAARHTLKNIVIRWALDHKGNSDLEKLLSDIAAEHGNDPEMWQAELADRMVVGGYEDRVARGLTGDWLIYAKHEGQNYYLDLATHTEGREPDSLYRKLFQSCNAEFPFAFAGS